LQVKNSHNMHQGTLIGPYADRADVVLTSPSSNCPTVTTNRLCTETNTHMMFTLYKSSLSSLLFHTCKQYL